MRLSGPFVMCGWLCILGVNCSTATDGGSGTGGSSGTGNTSGAAGTSSGSSGSGGTGGGTGGDNRAGTTGAAGAGNMGTAGATGMAGTTGDVGRGGGSAGTTGSAGRGGTTGVAGTTGSGGTGTSNCTFNVMSSTSTKIATVGIVSWSTSLVGVQQASIEFGLTTSYGMTAPVDLTVPNYRTLLLGMKASKPYHYRITATGSGGTCTSSDYTIMTGALANGLVKPTITTNNASALYGGFLITGQYVQGTGAGATAYILDADGDYVWWYSIGSDVTGAVMDYAGTHMWINNANVPNGTTRVHRVTMDGMTDDDYSSQFTGMNHQVVVLPDETVAFYAYNDSIGCEDIKERAPNGTVKTIVNSQRALNTTGACHLNNVQYSKQDDTLVFSDLDHAQIAKVKRTDGSTVWILNGTTRTFTGDTWPGGEHGIHILGLDDFVIFNNNSRMAAGGTAQLGGSGDGSIAIEIKLDLPAKTVTKTWFYKAMGSMYQNDVMGDVQRLANGNTMVAYSTKGIIREVDSGGNVLQELKTTANFGYIQKRATLYGPPPR